LLPAHAQRNDLDRIRGDILRLRKQLEDVRRQAQSAERELQEVDLELGIHTHELELASAAEAKLAAEQQGLEAQIAQLVPRIARQKDDLRKRVVVLYRLGSLSYVRMLLSIDSDRNPLEAISMLSYLVSRDARLVSSFQATRQQLAVRTAQLVEKRDRLHRTRLVVEERRRAVATSYATKAALVARLRTTETGTAQQLAALEEKARRLQRLVDALSRQKSGLEPATDIRAFQGALDWPVRGRVFEEFGRQRNPKFATYTINNGLKIEAAAGTQVRAVFQGTVLFSQWFKGYGNLIILDHGNRIFSLYGNLKGPSVAVGDRVATGQSIAGVGESEETNGGHLYFEVRQDNRPDDPRKWLR
ncbi:MAG TPA: peptidoglycan DD-metalloendopeptidase family protein, partial [Thermoanaerobaculia bacterium]|nr:peptidoglycan DD-metalloendopeptidase family protein [Thermoanaerobaculia bacterium]